MEREDAMPVANIRGVNLNYEVRGTHGPWMALSPGGRRSLDMVKSLAQRMANAGYRVLIHDRRNCGLSDIAIGVKAPNTRSGPRTFTSCCCG
jgi:pimeloyl-ACP methyl ester carboxylesterase